MKCNVMTLIHAHPACRELVDDFVVNIMTTSGRFNKLYNKMTSRSETKLMTLFDLKPLCSLFEAHLWI